MTTVCVAQSEQQSENVRFAVFTCRVLEEACINLHPPSLGVFFFFNAGPLPNYGEYGQCFIFLQQIIRIEIIN